MATGLKELSGSLALFSLTDQKQRFQVEVIYFIFCILKYIFINKDKKENIGNGKVKIKFYLQDIPENLFIYL